MITIFRNIRKGLVGKAHVRKYLLYAIGEIALVVLGILIALQINNWNQKRIDRNKEQLLLKEIHAEFMYNKEELLNTLDYYGEVRSKYSKLINSFPIDPNSYDLDSLSLIFVGTTATLDVDISKGSIATLINSSAFDIISNPEMRSLLLQWNDLINNYKEAESLLIQFTVDIFFPYLDEKIPFPYHEGIRDHRIDLSFLGSVKFENMIKRRRNLISDMSFIATEYENSRIIKAMDRIIELSGQMGEE